MSRPSPALLAALCLFVVGVGLVIGGAAGATDSGPVTYVVDETDGEVHRYADLSEPARDVVDAGADGSAVAVDDVPSEFRSGRWNFVRDGDELACFLPTDDADSGDVSVTFAQCGGFAFEYEELSERGQTLFTAAMENPDGYVSFAGAPPAGLGTASINGVDVADAPEEEGRYYVFANERVYEFGIYGAGPLGGFGEVIYALIVFALGLVLIAGSAYGYRISAVHAPAAAAVGASVYLVQPLAEAVGLLRWSIRLDGYSPWGVPFVIALAVGGVAYVLPELYAFARRYL
ncbi:hypothetical protein SAMN04488067_10893 [Halorubrum xinjiangense]|uniref:Uncharacterized protein n=1 Tax=Halorubrum xinjiangense TaxID=261291 RepID=A0A1G7NSX1_9EURY|nr:hypothetical protein [Halorubrum xinjiangense]SDF77017.1 hypothetical protein SAMN04488067_10893 [Halorubrum xinjiangense]